MPKLKFTLLALTTLLLAACSGKPGPSLLNNEDLVFRKEMGPQAYSRYDYGARKHQVKRIPESGPCRLRFFYWSLDTARPTAFIEIPLDTLAPSIYVSRSDTHYTTALSPVLVKSILQGISLFRTDTLPSAYMRPSLNRTFPMFLCSEYWDTKQNFPLTLPYADFEDSRYSWLYHLARDFDSLYGLVRNSDANPLRN